MHHIHRHIYWSNLAAADEGSNVTARFACSSAASNCNMHSLRWFMCLILIYSRHRVSYMYTKTNDGWNVPYVLLWPDTRACNMHARVYVIYARTYICIITHTCACTHENKWILTSEARCASLLKATWGADAALSRCDACSQHALSSCVGICIYVCKYVCMYVCLYVCMCMCVCMHMYACGFMHVCLCICVYCVYVCMCTCVYVCICIRVYVCECVCMHFCMCACMSFGMQECK